MTIHLTSVRRVIDAGDAMLQRAEARLDWQAIRRDLIATGATEDSADEQIVELKRTLADSFAEQRHAIRAAAIEMTSEGRKTR